MGGGSGVSNDAGDATGGLATPGADTLTRIVMMMSCDAMAMLLFADDCAAVRTAVCGLCAGRARAVRGPCVAARCM